MTNCFKMRQRAGFFGLLLSLCGTSLLFAYCAAGVEYKSRDADVPFGELEQRWQSAVRELGLPGLAVSVIQDDRAIYAKGFGSRTLDPNDAFTPTTPVYIASATKTFITLAVMTLVEDGRIDLDAPVKQYLPRFQLSDPGLTERITIRDLLCHRYGLSNWPITFAEAYTGLCNDDFYYRELPHSEIKGSWGYSNLHFTLLGRVITAVTGQPWQDYLRDKIFKPAGMFKTTAHAQELYGHEDAAQPLEKVNGEWLLAALRKTDNTMHAAGGMGSTAEDLARWIRLHLDGGAIDGTRIVSRESIDTILTPQTKPGTRFFRFGREQMGLGWYLGSYKNELLVHHFGSFAGAHTHVSFMPEHGIGVAVVANSNEDVTKLVHLIACDIYDVLLGFPSDDSLASFVRDMKKQEARAGRERRDEASHTVPVRLSMPSARYAGVYQSERWGTLEVRDEQGAPSARIGAVPLSLFGGKKDEPQAETPLGTVRVVFQCADGETVTSVLIESEDGSRMEFVREKP